MVKIKLKFFSIIKDITGIHELEIDFNGRTVNELLNFIKSKWPQISEIESEIPLIVLIDGKVAKITDKIPSNECEIAILPPVSGG